MVIIKNRYEQYIERAAQIGARINALRKEANITQSGLLRAIYKSESSTKTVREWERGTKLPDLSDLCHMAEIFECDIGYLLCDYNTKTWQAADISACTGLSEAAVSVLRKRHNRPGVVYDAEGNMHFVKSPGYLMLNQIIEAPKFTELMQRLNGLRDYRETHHPKKGKVSDVLTDAECKEFFMQYAEHTFHDLLNEQFSDENIKQMPRNSVEESELIPGNEAFSCMLDYFD